MITTREEQIKYAGEIISHGCSDELEAALKKDFPELRESEDERIISSIIAVLENDKKHYLKEIAWLEKKKEQKQIKWTDLTWKDIVELEGIINNVHYEFRNGIGQESFGKEVLEKFREYKGDEYLDEIEQKPAEWRPTHEQMVALSWAANGMLDNDSPSAGDIKASLRSLYNDLESKPIKTTEWSEEDELQLNAAIDIISNTGLDITANWIKSLPERFKFQPKIEWSAKDKQMLSSIQNDLVIIAKESGGERRKKYLQKVQFIEELFGRPQPHWKPSEEQMKALEKAIIRVHSDDEIPILCELRQQLKKLM